MIPSKFKREEKEEGEKQRTQTDRNRETWTWKDMYQIVNSSYLWE